MRKTWAIAGVDLHLDLSGTRVRAAIETALREAVRSGRLAPAARLPSSRTLAADLDVARNTVAEAYSQLVAEGWLTARVGSGTRVAERPGGAEESFAPVEAPARLARYDLRPGSPNLSAFPRTAWLAAARRALDGAPDEALGYSDPQGRPELRRALADYLARARGVRATADRILICSGFTQAFALLAEVLAKRESEPVLAIEEFTQPGIAQVAVAKGLKLQRLEVDERGAVVSELSNADAVLLTPAHQFPVGVPLDAERRSQVVDWARTGGGWVIEDDYDGEFRYDRQPLGALQSRAPDQVIYAGTASKTLVPGLRLAWLVVPARLMGELVEAKAMADRQTATLDQLTLAELISSGNYDRQIRRSRLDYRQRRDRLISALQEQVPEAHVTGIAAGLHALVDLPPGQSETDVVARAAEHGLALEGLHSYAGPDARHNPALVVGYSAPPQHAYSTAIARLCAVLAGSDAHR